MSRVVKRVDELLFELECKQRFWYYLALFELLFDSGRDVCYED